MTSFCYSLFYFILLFYIFFFSKRKLLEDNQDLNQLHHIYVELIKQLLKLLQDHFHKTILIKFNKFNKLVQLMDDLDHQIQHFLH